MPRQPLIFAVDIGTSAARAVLFDAAGRELSHSRASYPTSYPQPGWSEQHADQVADAVIEVLREAVGMIPPGHELVGVVFSTQMYSILALDTMGAPLTVSLTWGDVRSAEIATELRSSLADMLRRTGCPVQAIYPLSKILWLKRHLDLPADARFVSIKDYVLFRLTGLLLTDWSTASASGLLDIARHEWDASALTACGITTDHLARLVAPRHVINRWRPEVCQATGIAGDTPIIVGAGDAPLANIGVGATAKGTLAINLGTSAAARALIAEPQIDPDGRLWTYVADVDQWVIGGIIGSGGLVYEWLLKDVLSGQTDLAPEALFQAADELAGSVPPGADDLLFIPYLSGEQSPGWKVRSTGMIHGMTLRHHRGHFVRAAIEGVAFALLRAAQPIEDIRRQIAEKIYMTGGLSTSTLWRQVVANVFGASIVVPHSPESSARGAAILAWMALGMAGSYVQFAQPETLLSPDPELHDLYRRRFEAFCHVNARLSSSEHPHES